MSFENKNLYALLGNDVEDDTAAPVLAPREVVKKNTSSKKADVAPASADPAKAKKKTTKTTGNDAALKNKADNKSVAGPTATPTKHFKKPLDRHSRTAKTDSKKKLKQGWGEGDSRELEGETEGLEDAVAELEEEADIEAEPVVAKKSLNDYFAELQLKQQELDGVKQIRQANAGAEDKWTSEEKIEKTEEAFFESTASKKAKSKAPKEKKFLDIEAHFADEQPASTGSRGGARGGARGGTRGSSRGAARGGARGGARGAFNGAKRGGDKKPEAPKAEINDKNFPSL